jgi:hypothetical protein
VPHAMEHHLAAASLARLTSTLPQVPIHALHATPINLAQVVLHHHALIVTRVVPHAVGVVPATVSLVKHSTTIPQVPTHALHATPTNSVLVVLHHHAPIVTLHAQLVQLVPLVIANPVLLTITCRVALAQHATPINLAQVVLHHHAPIAIRVVPHAMEHHLAAASPVRLSTTTPQVPIHALHATPINSVLVVLHHHALIAILHAQLAPQVHPIAANLAPSITTTLALVPHA